MNLRVRADLSFKNGDFDPRLGRESPAIFCGDSHEENSKTRSLQRDHAEVRGRAEKRRSTMDQTLVEQRFESAMPARPLTNDSTEESTLELM